MNTPKEWDKTNLDPEAHRIANAMWYQITLNKDDPSPKLMLADLYEELSHKHKYNLLYMKALRFSAKHKKYPLKEDGYSYYKWKLSTGTTNCTLESLIILYHEEPNVLPRFLYNILKAAHAITNLSIETAFWYLGYAIDIVEEWII